MGRYTEAHADPQGAGDGRPTAIQIIRDENLEGKLTGKVIVLTGTTAGIGLETARALSATGATLILTARDLKRAETVLAGILEPGRVSLVEMDQASLASVRSAAAIILEKSNNQVNILVNNAGVLGSKEIQFTQDGHEIHFGINHLSHFLLFHKLKHALIRSSTATFPSRVVMVSSSGHRVCELFQSDDYNMQKQGYNVFLAYPNSKVANVYMANEIERRYSQKGLHATSLHPGAINTNITRNLGDEFVNTLIGNPAVIKILKSPEQGAATTIVAAVGREWTNKGGRYLEDCEEAKRGKDDHDSLGVGYVSHTYDQQSAERLWSDSLRLVGLEHEENE
jgi:NAD(P)-dependent dehydrogenase (short-subunit alcohol dehydrogenase family)